MELWGKRANPTLTALQKETIFRPIGLELTFTLSSSFFVSVCIETHRFSEQSQRFFVQDYCMDTHQLSLSRMVLFSVITFFAHFN